MTKKFWSGPVPSEDDFGNPIKDYFIDGKTTLGPWAIMSPVSFIKVGEGIGKGVGQAYRKTDAGWEYQDLTGAP